MSSNNKTHEFTKVVSPEPTLMRTASVLIPGGLLALLSTTVVGVTIPDVISDLDTNISSAQWVVTAYLLAAGLGIAISAWASVRFGVRTTWMAALGLFVLGALGSAVAPTIETFVIARAIQGFGGGALEPIMLTVLARAAGPQRMGRVMGMAAAVMSIGPLAGPALGGLGMSTLGWRWIFVASAVAGVAIAIGSVIVLSEEPTKAIKLDLPGLVLVAAMTMLGMLGFSRASTPAGFDIWAVCLIAAAGIALMAFVQWARRQRDRAIVDISTFRVPGFTPAILIMTMTGATVYPLFFGLPQLYQEVMGVSAMTAGALMIPYGIGNLIAMPLAGRLSDMIDVRHLVWSGTASTLLGLVALLVAGPQASTIALLGSSFLLGLGVGAIASPTAAELFRVLPARLVPSGSSTLFIANLLGGALGVSILTIMIGGHSWSAEVGTSPLWVPASAIAGIGIIANWMGRAASRA
ncbi:DHA2 family efflux MFS transporter permease subunit [Natronoglycomyces albus]|uniref:DHA2 family efflux MFS transporter permease subunit n=1 Tax=Natronoglycomyces albus TaxID=2811108 RepID=A0A895XQV3_9ACTN|nr:DHA2 family efflux MFS transporter permease subunit [Natronoglycomyces albus]QSB04936.1 DHA2 family efflux MFS transporter permease subunit [Natronoglycomyces albus]